MHTGRQFTTWQRPAAAVALLMAVCAPAAADSTYWQAGTGDWFVDGNWTAGVPSEGDTAAIDNGGAARIASGSAAAVDLTVGAGASGSVEQTGGVAVVSGRTYVAQGYGSAGGYDLSGAAALTTGDLHVGWRGAGTFSQAGATCTVTGQLYVAYGATATGTYLLTGAGRLSTDILSVGYQGAGAFVQTGGVTRVANDVFVGDAAGAVGRYELAGGELSARDEFVGGPFGAGVFTQSGGVNAAEGNVVIASGAGSSGTYVLSGPGRLTARSLGVGLTGRGAFIQTGGVCTVRDVNIAPHDSAAGRCEVGGDAELNAERIRMGEATQDSKASFLQTGGTVTVSKVLHLAAPASTYTLTGGSLTAAGVTVGGLNYTAGATFHQSGGVHVVAGELRVSGPDASYLLTGSGRLETGAVTVRGSDEGEAAFHHVGGVHVAATIALESYSAYDLGPGADLASREVDVGGTFTQTGGTHAAGLVTVNGGGRYDFLGGSLTLAGLDLHGVMDFGGRAASLDWGDAFLELTAGSFAAAADVSVSLGDGSLVVLRPGRDPTDAFASFTTTGLVHTTGTTLVVPAGRDYAWAGHLDDHVRCEANLAAPPGTHLDLNGGLTVAPGVRVDLAAGALTVLDDISTMAGQALAAAGISVGPTGPGRLSHTAGAVTVGQLLVGGPDAGADGTYEISGDAELTADVVRIENGKLRIVGDTPGVTVSGLLHLDDGGFIDTWAGEIRMAGASLENRVRYAALHWWDPVAYEDVALIFEGGSGVVSDFEVSAPDDPSRAHLPVLRRLQLGGAAPGRIRLLNEYDNWAGVDGEEALFVDELALNAGAAVDLNGLSLYYYNGGDLKRLVHGDANLDGAVDVYDLAVVGNNYALTGMTWAGGDFTGDGAVDVYDLAFLAGNYGQATPGGGQPVPEPATLALLAAGACVALLRRRGVLR